MEEIGTERRTIREGPIDPGFCSNEGPKCGFACHHHLPSAVQVGVGSGIVLRGPGNAFLVSPTWRMCFLFNPVSNLWL
jgi:hypothetical protein